MQKKKQNQGKQSIQIILLTWKGFPVFLPGVSRSLRILTAFRLKTTTNYKTSWEATSFPSEKVYGASSNTSVYETPWSLRWWLLLSENKAVCSMQEQSCSEYENWLRILVPNREREVQEAITMTFMVSDVLSTWKESDFNFYVQVSKIFLSILLLYL